MKTDESQIRVQLALPQDKVSIHEKLKGAWQLIRADKPIGILLLLWPALWALWIAGQGKPDWYVTLVFILGSVLVRSAGCAVNDFADRRIDQRVMRTCLRPIATGIIQPREALIIFGVLIASALMLVLTLNLHTILLSFVAVVLALIYPYTKRYTYFPQLVLGFAFGWIVPLAFSALGVEFQPVTWVLFVITMLWVLIYDTEYAMVDRDEDKLIGVKSIAIFFGEYDVLAIAVMQFIMIGLLLLVGEMMDRSWFYFVGVVLSSFYFVRQQILMSTDKKSGAFAAFLNNNCFGMTLFLLLLVDYIITG
jgi:4-hydroxybenzoate polyprenyltransferase